MFKKFIEKMFRVKQKNIVQSQMDRPNQGNIGLSVPNWIPTTLDPSEMEIRTADELYQRLIALWAVVGTAKTGEPYFREYMETNSFQDWLSPREKTYLISISKSERDEVQFSWQSECLYFLAWCGGLFDNLEVPTSHSELGDWFDFFPEDNDDVGRLRDAINVRDKKELLNWSEILYDLHWKVRHSNLSGLPIPDGMDGEVIQEWHYAVNWMLYFAEEPEEWDEVSTDT